MKTVIEIEKFLEPPCSGEVNEWKEVHDTQWFFDAFTDDKTYCDLLDVHCLGASECNMDRFDNSKCAELDKLHGSQYNDLYKYVFVLVKRVVFDDSACRNRQSS